MSTTLPRRLLIQTAILLLVMVAGIWTVLHVGGRLEREAIEVWRGLAEDEAEESTLIAQFWVTQSFTYMRGMTAALASSDDLPAEDFANAREAVDNWFLDVEVASLAFVQRVPKADRAQLQALIGGPPRYFGRPWEVALSISESFIVTDASSGNADAFQAQILVTAEDSLTIDAFSGVLQNEYDGDSPCEQC